MLSDEVEDMLWKGAIVPTPRPGEKWELQHLFPGTQKGWRPQAHPEFEVLQLKYLQGFVQNGDTAVHCGGHASAAVDSQHGSEGCVLPCTGGGSASSVSQIPLAEHKLPVTNSSVHPLMGSSSIPHSVVEAPRIPTVCIQIKVHKGDHV